MKTFGFSCVNERNETEEEEEEKIEIYDWIIINNKDLQKKGFQMGGENIVSNHFK